MQSYQFVQMFLGEKEEMGMGMIDISFLVYMGTTLPGLLLLMSSLPSPWCLSPIACLLLLLSPFPLLAPSHTIAQKHHTAGNTPVGAIILVGSQEYRGDWGPQQAVRPRRDDKAVQYKLSHINVSMFSMCSPHFVYVTIQTAGGLPTFKQQSRITLKKNKQQESLAMVSNSSNASEYRSAWKCSLEK
jgi:hypothetical protein